MTKPYIACHMMMSVDGRIDRAMTSKLRGVSEYYATLDGLGIPWIARGEERIDVAGAVDVLAREFGVKRMACVGGGNINAAFLDAGLLDEASALIGPGIDARGGMASTFDGLPMDREPFQLELKHIESYADGAIWIRYDVKR